MHCPFCRHPDSRVIDSRTSDDGLSIRRRRQCPECGGRFSTIETASLNVIKRSGVIEPFSREKVISGVRKACQGRPVTEADLAVLAQTVEGTTIGRPHIADALVAAGLSPDRSAAFATILATDTPYYVPHYAPDAVAAVRGIRAAGGVPVFAHPGADGRGRVVSDAVIEEMTAAGLAGLEVFHRDHDERQRARLEDLARTLGLFVTGSSDYHGAGKPNRLGENTTARTVLEQIEELGQLDVIR